MDTELKLGLTIVNPSLKDHKKEDVLLGKFINQFNLDKQEHSPNFEKTLFLHVESSVRIIHRNGKHLWFITYDSQIIGYTTVSWQAWPIRDSVAISDFFIDKPYRGMGLGKKALQMIIEKLFELCPDSERVGLVVMEGNHVAESLYEKLGFKTKLKTMVLERD